MRADVLERLAREIENEAPKRMGFGYQAQLREFIEQRVSDAYALGMRDAADVVEERASRVYGGGLVLRALRVEAARIRAKAKEYGD